MSIQAKPYHCQSSCTWTSNGDCIFAFLAQVAWDESIYLRPINFRSLEKEGIFSLRSKLSIILWKKRKTGEITLKAFNNVTRKEGNKLSITRLKTERVFSDCQLSLWNSSRYVYLYNYTIQKCLWAQKIIFCFPIFLVSFTWR